MGDCGGMLFGGGFMWLLWLLLFVGLFIVIKASLRGSDAQQGESALEILKKRYARNEISEEEFKRLRKDLEDK